MKLGLKGYMSIGFTILGFITICIVAMLHDEDGSGVLVGIISIMLLFSSMGFYFGRAIEEAIKQLAKEIKK